MRTSAKNAKTIKLFIEANLFNKVLLASLPNLSNQMSDRNKGMLMTSPRKARTREIVLATLPCVRAVKR